MKTFMHRTLLITLIYLVCSQLNVVQILQLSVTPEAPSSPLVGSVQGGTILYIRATGLDSALENNQVSVGPYGCALIDIDSSGQFMSCVTAAATDQTQMSDLEIRVSSKTKRHGVCKLKSCLFSYQQSSTATVYQVVPRTAFPESRLSILASHPSFQGSPYQVSMRVNDVFCLYNTTYALQSYSGSITYLNCQLAKDLKVGDATFSYQSFYGRAVYSPRLAINPTSVDSRQSSFLIVPQVVGISAQDGGVKGNAITVQLKGASSNLSSYSCSVAGESCTVTQVTIEQVVVEIPPLSINNQEFGRVRSSNPFDNLYVGSGGVSFFRYQCGSLSINDAISAIRQQSSSCALVYSETRASIYSDPTDRTVYTTLHSGYLLAELDGNYTFIINSDDSSAMYISTAANSSDPATLVKTVWLDGYSSSATNPYILNQPNQSAMVFLSQGYHYFEVFHQNTGGKTHLSVALGTPKVDSALPVTGPEVQLLSYQPSQIAPQIIQISVEATGGSFRLSYISGTSKYSTSDIPFNATAQQLKSSLNKLPCFGSTYKPSSISLRINSNARVWLVEYESYRSSNCQLSLTVNSTSLTSVVSATAVQVQPHSDPLRGTFRLSYGSIDILYKGGLDIPYNIPSNVLKGCLSASLAAPDVEVETKNGSFDDGPSYLITFLGSLGHQAPATLNLSGLYGGKTSSSIVGGVTILLEGNNQQYFHTIPYRFLYKLSDKPALTLSINGIMAACDNCSYSYNQSKTPGVSAFTQNSNVLSVSLNSNAPVGQSIASYKVTFAGQDCNVTTASASQLSCLLPVAINGVLPLQAGNHYPIIQIYNTGYAAIAAGVPSLSVFLTISSVSSSVGSPAGGLLLTIFGTGFPLSFKNSMQAQVYFCQGRGRIIDSNNTQIKVMVPTASGCDVVLSSYILYGGSNVSIPFNYNLTAPTISSLSINSSSPAQNITLCVTGNGFSSDSSQARIHLIRQSVIYELQTINSSNSAVCGYVAGGTSGTYQVAVLRNNFGYSPPASVDNNLYYLGSFVSDISPLIGPIGGGTLLTITGTNFIGRDSQVYIGGQACAVASRSSTVITCRTPPAKNYTQQVVPVQVRQRLTEVSLCSALSCSFTYANAESYFVNPLSNAGYNTGDNITITGTNIQQANVAIGGILCIPIINTDTQIIVAMPSLPYGTYLVQVQGDNGYAHPTISVSNTLSISNISGLTGSSQGNIVEFSGQGLPNNTNDNNLSVFLTCNSVLLDLQLVDASPSSTTIRVPPGSYQHCEINYSYQSLIIKSPYSTSLLLTPNITVSPQSVNASLSMLTFTVSSDDSRAASYNMSMLEFQGLYENNHSNGIVYWGIATDKPDQQSQNFNVSIPAGRYSVRVFIQDYGFGNAVTVNVQFPSISMNTQIVSYNGGTSITLTGVGFDLQQIWINQVSICGILAKIKSVTNTGLAVLTPSIAKSVSNKTALLRGKPFCDPNGTYNSRTAFDQNIETSYWSASSVCFVGLDFGVQNRAYVDSISYILSPTLGKSDMKMFQGGVFEGSNDTSDWQTIATIGNQIFLGDNILRLSRSVRAHRYIRFRHNSTSQCKMAQISVIGQLLAAVNDTSRNCEVIVWNPAGDITLPTSLIYQFGRAVNVTSMSPLNGSSLGGTVLTINGDNFGSNISVMIDGNACTILTTKEDKITCITAPKNIPSISKFELVSDGEAALLPSKVFIYADSWSTASTYWSGESAPRDRDSLVVRYGTTFIVDSNTTLLGKVVVDGVLLFADSIDLLFVCESITISSTGRLSAGTLLQPRVRSLRIITNLIKCQGCTFELNGVRQQPYWAKLSSTSNAGATTITVSQKVNWDVGDEILVTATEASQVQNEVRTIVDTREEGRNLQLNQSLKYQHIAISETYNGTSYSFKAEIALLTKNIVIQGLSNVVDSGVSLLFKRSHAKAPIINVTGVSVLNCGSRLPLMHCFDIRVDGTMYGSMIAANTIRNSFTRGISASGVSDLVISQNIILNAHGSSISLDKGSEMRNIITHNLAVSTLNASYIQSGDLTASGISTQSPLNNISCNTVVTSEFDGLVFRGNKLTAGSLALGGVCPLGLKVYFSTNNTLRSCTNNGLTVTQLVLSNYPCQIDFSVQTNSDTLINYLSNYSIWGNLGAGINGLRIGGLQIFNFSIVQHNGSSIDLCKTDLSSSGVFMNSTRIIAGFSNQALTSSFGYNNSSAVGLLIPNSNMLNLDDVLFSNFGANMTVLTHHASSCASDTLPITSTLTTNRLQFVNINGRHHNWTSQDSLIVDRDGTLAGIATTSPSVGGWLMPYSALLTPNPTCRQATTSWGLSSVCVFPTQVRGVRLFNTKPSSLNNANLSIMVHAVNSSLVNKTYNSGWSMHIPLNEEYDLFWSGADFSEFSIERQDYWLSTDSVMLHFNYTSKIDSLSVVRYTSLGQSDNVNNSLSLSSSNCSHGDYSHNSTSKVVSMCLKGQPSGSTVNTIVVKAQRCTTNCLNSSSRYWSNSSGWQSGRTPRAGENVTIRSDEVVILDIDPPTLLYVLVQGRLIFDQNNNRILESSYIEIRGGSVEVGSSAEPYANTAIIRFVQPSAGSELTFNQLGSSGSYGLIINSGQLRLYGQVPNVLGARLTSIARKSSRVVSMASTVGWNVGEQVAIGPSYSNQTEDDYATVTSVSNANVTLDRNLLYEHFGDASVTISNNYGDLDARAVITKLSRNIHIVGDNPNYRIVIGNGSTVTLSAVEVVGGGSGAATLTVRDNLQQINISSSSIHHCEGDCVAIVNSRNIELSQNSLYRSQGRLVYAQNTSNITISSNLLTAAKQPPSSVSNAPEVSCVTVQTSARICSSNFVVITNNTCQGSQGTGYSLPHLPCLDATVTKWFKDNSAGSCLVGFLFTEPISPAICIAGAYLSAYTCNVGIMMNPETQHSAIQYSNMMITDCSRALTLRSSYDSGDNSALLLNSYISGYSRPNCAGCYTDNTITGCKNGHAVRMFTSTTVGDSYQNPISDILSYDSIRSKQCLDSKAFLENVTFENYLNYNRLLPYCSGMSVFRRHTMASDNIASHYLKNTRCINCEVNAFARFDPPSKSWLGALGGCGKLQCTGANNYFIYDSDGSFLGFAGHLLANNSWIGQNDPLCSFNDRMNGYVCNGSLAVLEYASTAADNETRRIWPVEVVWVDQNFSTLTSPWRRMAWGWGNIPLNIRPAMFLTVVELNQTYEVTYHDSPPTNATYQLQKREYPSGRAGDWVILKLTFPTQQSIDVYAMNSVSNNTLMQSFSDVTLLLANPACGQNSIDFKNGIVYFAVTGFGNCTVRVQATNYLLITFILDVALADFNSNSGSDVLRATLCQQLGIPLGRVRVRQLRSGSTIVDVTISAAPNSSNPRNELNIINGKIVSMLADGTLVFSAPLLSYNSTVSIIGEATIVTEIRDIQPAIRGLIGVVIVVGLVMFASIFVYRRLRIRKATVHPEEETNIQPNLEGVGEKSSELNIGDDLKFND